MTRLPARDARAGAPTDPPHQLRAAGQATRNAIARSAQELFAERGFNDTSVRAIAARAGVDPALVIRHFGSKEALFLQAVDREPDALEVFDGPLETLGRRLVAHYLARANAHTRQAFTAMIQASHRPQVREEMTRLNRRIFLDPLAARLEGEHRELRARLAWAQISGLIHTVTLGEDLPGEAAEIVALYGDSVQLLLTPQSPATPPAG